MRLLRTLALAALAFLSSATAGTPIAIGEALKLPSSILGEERRILVSTPADYGRNQARYPVLYLTDGDAHLTHTRGTVDFLARNGLMPNLIIVAIPNTNRTRDLTPTRALRPRPDGSRQEVPNSGGAGKFLDFFEKELFPFVEANYRTSPYRIFAGHSLGGMLALHILLERPELFNAYVSVSPSLDWDDKLILRRAHEALKPHKEFQKTLFVTMGDEETGEPRPNSFDRLQSLLKSVKAKGFSWEAKLMPDEDHGSVVLRSHYWGLRKVFEGWRLPLDRQTRTFKGDLADIQSHYAGLTARLGYPVDAPEQPINQVGYQFLGQKELDKAIAVFRYNLALHPASANAHDSLGEALENAGKLAEARDAYARAVELGQKHQDPLLAAFTQNLERITARMK
ncbi:MAG: prolyl oligopeptidase family serine peptidase [Holophagaceae bacterium]|uniref:Prolyl oligopeptidase family serine peptidase n=1 Tax=Candidatus Geothrix skivensis TaxID=2954439 RepID=A0A9D7SJC7_9BACT|nr:prolyl oligopeptidase family serine peptidase [Candidatus Geothrix skivensis]